MLAEGADVIDVGGESTRPGSQRVPAEKQKRRVVEVVRRVREEIDATPPREAGGITGTISVDTTLADLTRGVPGEEGVLLGFAAYSPDVIEASRPALEAALAGFY